MAAAAGSYLPTARTGNLLFTAGQLPFVDGRLPATGRVGAEVSPEDAKGYARQAALNLLAAVDAAVGLDAVERVVKVVGFVASAEGFTGQPGVINGASDLLAEVFGEAGRHARSAVGVAELPLGAPVEVEAILQVREPNEATCPIRPNESEIDVRYGGVDVVVPRSNDEKGAGHAQDGRGAAGGVPVRARQGCASALSSRSRMLARPSWSLRSVRGAAVVVAAIPQRATS